MNKLTESPNFSEDILRIDVDTLVKGYDGNELGPANEQAQALANRTLWLKEKLEDALKQITEITKKEYVISVNDTTGVITLSYADVGAAAKDHTHTVDQIKTTDDADFVSSVEKEKWNNKQDALVSNESIKTINGTTLLGSENIEITPSSIGAAEEKHEHVPSDIKTDDDHQFISIKEKETYSAKQDQLVSGKNIATVFGKTLLSSDDINLDNVTNLPEIIKDLLISGEGIDLSLSEDNKHIVISKAAVDSGAYRVIEFNNASANGAYYFRGTEGAYGFSAYALKETTGESDQIIINYDNPQQDLTQSDLPDFDDSGNVADGQSTKNYNVISVDDDGKIYASDGITLSSAAPGLVDITSALEPQSIIPVLKSATTDETISVISSSNTSPFFAWKAFSTPYTESEQNSIPANSFYRDTQVWNKKTSDVYIGFKSTKNVTINQYRIQAATKFATANIASPIGWQVEGRNEDTDSWTVFDTRNGQPIIGSSNWLTYNLNQSVTYKQFRIVVTDVNNTGGRTGFTRIKFFNVGKAVFEGSDKNYYLPNEQGSFTQVDKDTFSFSTDGFIETKTPIKITELETITPFKVYAGSAGTVTLSYYKAVPCIAIHSPAADYSQWEELDQLKISELYNPDDKENIKIAVTVNETEYYIFKDSTWTKIGDLTISSDSASLICQKGMSVEELENITSDQWQELFVDLTKDFELGIAYGAEISNKANSVIPKSLVGSLEPETFWEKVGPETVKIKIKKDKIIFNPLVVGNYKFCYKFS